MYFFSQESEEVLNILMKAAKVKSEQSEDVQDSKYNPRQIERQTVRQTEVLNILMKVKSEQSEDVQDSKYKQGRQKDRQLDRQKF